MIPANVYPFKFDKIDCLSKSDTNSPFLGLIVIKTVPNSGGSNSSPPTTETDSVFGYICCITDS